MAITPRSAAIGLGAFTGAYASDITENPFLGVINAGIGAAAGSLAVLPEEGSFKEAFKSTGAPTLTIEEIQRLKKSKEEALLIQREQLSKRLTRDHLNRSNLENLIMNNQRSLTLRAEKTDQTLERFYKRIESLRSQRDSIRNQYSEKTAFTKNAIKRSLGNLDERIEYLEKVSLPLAERSYKERLQRQFNRRVRHSEYILGDQHTFGSILKYAKTLPDYKQREERLAKETVNLVYKEKKDHYRDLADKRVRSKIFEYGLEVQEAILNIDSLPIERHEGYFRPITDSLQTRTYISPRGESFKEGISFIEGTKEFAEARIERRVYKKELEGKALNKREIKWKEANSRGARDLEVVKEVFNPLTNKWERRGDHYVNAVALSDRLNRLEWYLDKTSTPKGIETAIDLSLRSTANRILEYKTAREVAPSFVRSIGEDSPATIANINAFFTAKEIDDSISAQSSFNIQNLKDSITKYKSQEYREELSKSITESLLPEQRKIEEFWSKIKKEKLEANKNKVTEVVSKIRGVRSDFTEFKDKKRSKIEEYETYLKTHEDKFNRAVHLLKGKGIHINSPEDLINIVETTDDLKLLKEINQVTRGSRANLSKSVADKIPMLVEEVNSQDVESISRYFKDTLNNPEKLSLEKAQIISDKALGDITFIDGTASFVDKATGKRVTMPLTSYTEEGLRFHSMGKGMISTVSQFNPYGKQFSRREDVVINGVKRKLTVQDMMNGLDPELMLKFVPEGEGIQKTVDHMKSLMHYESQGARNKGESFLNPSGSSLSNNPSIISSQGLLDYGFTLNTDGRGNLREGSTFAPLQTISQGEVSDRLRLMTELAQEASIAEGGLFDNVSTNSLTRINREGFAGLSPFAPGERGDTTVGNRGYRVSNLNSKTSSLLGVLGEDIFSRQFSSSQAFEKLDVKDSNLFNKILPRLTRKNSNVLADGAGFYSMARGGDFKTTDTSVLKLPLSEVTLLNEELHRGLTSPEGISEYLRNNGPIHIGNEDLAYVGSDNRPIKLNNMYSRGSIVAAYTTEDDLRLVTSAEFDPNAKERNVKLYSLGTKSLNTGLEDEEFKLASFLGESINRGELKELPDGSLSYKGNKLSVKEFLQEFKRDFEKEDREIKYHLIGDANDSGIGKIIEKIQKPEADSPMVRDLLKLKGDTEETRRIASLTSSLFTEQKASIDLTASLAVTREEQIQDLISKAIAGDSLSLIELQQQGIVSANRASYDVRELEEAHEAWRSRFREVFGSGALAKSANKESLIDFAYENVKNSGIAEDILEGRALAVGSLNKGQSITGVGNRTGISWTAVQNLMMSGMTREDLNYFGDISLEKTYETRSSILEYRKSKDSINNIIDNQELKFLDMLNRTLNPEDRISRFKTEFSANQISEDLPYLTYNLSYDKTDLKSLNFSTISTDRSGRYETDSGSFNKKELDKSKMKVMEADTLYKYAEGAEKAKKEKDLLEVLKEYETITHKMYSGDNNLAKEVLSLYSDSSSIMQVKGIGGEAGLFAEKNLRKSKDNKNYWFISKEEAEFKAKQLGGTLVPRSTEYSTISTAQVFIPSKDVPGKGELIDLVSLLTREPAQGPLSTDLVHWAIDTTLEGEHTRNNAYVSNSSLIYKRGQFGDMDQDTVQTILGRFNSQEEIDQMNAKRSVIRSTFLEMKEILEDIAVKGSKKSEKNLYDFNEKDFNIYRTGSGIKGRERKTSAAPATNLASSYAKALETEFEGDSLNPRLLRGRMLAHQLVENLIKSSHKETESFSVARLQAVETLSHARRQFIGKDSRSITAKEYEKVLKENLPQFLQVENIKGDSNKAIVEQVLNDMIESEVKHSYKIGNNPSNPMDLAEHRFKNTWVDTLTNILKNHGLHDTDSINLLEEDLQTLASKSPKKIVEYAKEAIKSNKSVILGGLGAMAGVSLLTRESPSFSDSRDNMRQHSSRMLQASVQEPVGSTNDTPMGINTSTIKSNFITPKSFSNKNVKIEGSYSSELDSFFSEAQERTQDLSEALFGDAIRSARVQLL